MRLAPGDLPLTFEEVAAHYRMTVRQLRQVVRQRQVEVLRAGHTVRFDQHALNSLEDKLRHHATEKDDADTRISVSARPQKRSAAYEEALRMTRLVSRRRKSTPRYS